LYEAGAILLLALSCLIIRHKSISDMMSKSE